MDKDLCVATNRYNKHYEAMGVQPIVVIRDILTPEEFRGYLKGQMIRYAMRAGHKANEPTEKDISKYKHYGEWLCEFERDGTITI